MKVLFDTNVVLDSLLRRDPWYESAHRLWTAIDDGILTGYLSATTLTDIFYVARKILGIEKAFGAIGLCLSAFVICEVNRDVVEEAYKDLPPHDLEDNIQMVCGKIEEVDYIVTRDGQGFVESPVAVKTPDEIVKMIGEKKKGAE